MKKILLTVLGLATGFVSMAQLPVSQTSENRHAILEEFTGINCTFCPDGHAIGNTISAANPGTFHKIHIHSGSYANTTPDLRTTTGDAIDNASGLTGYPAGGINRGTGSWAMGRGSWSGAATTVMNSTSYVNLALEGSVDPTTRVLTVDVEVFYTGTAPTSTEYLTVALMQNNIPGPQIDGGNYNPTGWKCQPNVYKHMHVMRMHLNTGAPNGEAISTTTGAVVTKQYVTTLPMDLKSVSLELGELELVGFITAANNLSNAIVSGNEGPVTVMLTGQTEADMSSESNHTAPTDYCVTSFNPSINITNNSSSPVTGVDVSYSVNGTTTTDNLPTQMIAAGATYTHNFTPGALNTGSNEIVYDVAITDPTKADLSPLNNTSCPEFINVIPAAAFAQLHSEGFESMALLDEQPPNSIAINPDGVRAFVVNQGISSGVNWPLGGFGLSANSFRWDFVVEGAGRASSIVYEKLDFSQKTGFELRFNHAHALWNGNEPDKLEVFASTDCGLTWTSVWSKSGTSLSTAPNLTGARYYPQVSQWVSNTVDLSTYDGQAEVMLRFTGTSGNGNSLYFDDIGIFDGIAAGVEEELLNSSISMYPNPTNSTANISIDLKKSNNVNVEIFNTLGSKVFEENKGKMNSGAHTFSLDVANLNSGIYFVTFTIGDLSVTERLSVN